MDTTIERLRAILIRDYKLSADVLTPQAPLEALGIDSLGLVELLWNVEDEFKITLPGDPAPMPTFGDVVAFIDALVAQQGASAAPAAPAAAVAAGAAVAA